MPTTASKITTNTANEHHLLKVEGYSSTLSGQHIDSLPFTVTQGEEPTLAVVQVQRPAVPELWRIGMPKAHQEEGFGEIEAIQHDSFTIRCDIDVINGFRYQEVMSAAKTSALSSAGRIKESLCKSIEVGTSANLLALAEQLGCRGLKDACFDFLGRLPANLNVVVTSDDFEHLSTTCPSMVKELIAIGSAPRLVQ
ncbi:uncharacterized protein [Aegilops tauschii subsp. strangulata]|uniref:uncharacterized protein n=1 Tax=Aegilops tauschii subsp. strangulata TaxID=200361 RepID=UPI003CC83AD7